MCREFFVYIVTNKSKSVLYIGVTSDLLKRIAQHSAGQGSGFTSDYHVKHLIFAERFDSILDAIAREKQLKRWSRNKKEKLIRRINPEFLEIPTY